jgi:hypothetical protein
MYCRVIWRILQLWVIDLRDCKMNFSHAFQKLPLVIPVNFVILAMQNLAIVVYIL